MRASRLLLPLVLAAFAVFGLAQRGATLDRDRLIRIEREVRSAPNGRRAAQAIPKGLFDSKRERELVQRMSSGEAKARAEVLQSLSLLRVSAAVQPDAGALAKVKSIQSAPEYRRAAPGRASNWFGRALEGVSRWFEGVMRGLFGRKGPQFEGGEMPNLSAPGWLIYVVWIILAGIILVAAWPLVRLIRFRIARRQRKAKGILEEEPERTKSEYLNLADQLSASGDFRGAIRMLYLASLKRFDEARVARFDRGETNWEHLARIRSSPTLPLGLDFRPATAAFDHYWYGHRPAQRPDYERFVGWYDEVDGALRHAVAA